VVVTALGFDFTNGFHETGNAMATSIVTGAPPWVAVGVSSALNLIGAFLSFSVAATIASGLVNTGAVTLTVVFAGPTVAILWNLASWYLGIPSSSSRADRRRGRRDHDRGRRARREWQGLVSKVIVPAVLSPLIAGLVAVVGTWLAYRIARGAPEGPRGSGFRTGQVGSASMVFLAHGTNDAQKRREAPPPALLALAYRPESLYNLFGGPIR
jgi:PiT family inorganic phosphate transporter